MENAEIFISKEELFSKAMSYCTDTYEKKAHTITTEQALSEIKEGKFRETIEMMRDPIVPTDSKDSMKKGLKSYIFGGVFLYRNSESLLEYSNSCILDFDDIGVKNIIDAKNQLLEDPYICAAWISPKGAGLKALIAFEFSNITEEMSSENICLYHKFAYMKYKEYLRDIYPYPLDESGSDVTRLCYTSYDPDIGIKEIATKFKVDFTDVILAKNPTPKNKQKNSLSSASSEENVKNIQRTSNQSFRRIMKSIIKYLSKRNLSITSTERDWFLVGQAIANDFSYSIGKGYYLKLCRLDGERHDEVKSSQKIIDCYKQCRSEEGLPLVRIYRIIQFANKKGWRGTEEL